MEQGCSDSLRGYLGSYRDMHSAVLADTLLLSHYIQILYLDPTCMSRLLPVPDYFKLKNCSHVRKLKIFLERNHEGAKNIDRFEAAFFSTQLQIGTFDRGCVEPFESLSSFDTLSVPTIL